MLCMFAFYSYLSVKIILSIKIIQQNHPKQAGIFAFSIEIIKAIMYNVILIMSIENLILSMFLILFCDLKKRVGKNETLT